MPDAVAQETRLAATVALPAPAAPLDDPETEQKMRDEILLQKTYATRTKHTSSTDKTNTHPFVQIGPF